ncbi:MAG: hypothetical protein II777_05395, partial [Clostridia bacterium]|nr:hypothetical protein [Clostridia bacterium]
TLKCGSATSAVSTAGTASAGGTRGQMQGNMSGKQGQIPGNNSEGQTQQPGNGSGNQWQIPGNNQQQIPGMNGRQDIPRGGRQNGGFPNENPENNGEIPAPPEMNGETPELPDGEFPPEIHENENVEAAPQTSVSEEEQEAAAEPNQSVNWFQAILNAIRDFFRSIFKR